MSSPAQVPARSTRWRSGASAGSLCACACLLVLAAFGLAGAPRALAATHKTVTFEYDGLLGIEGVPQVWVVPPKVYTATFHIYGAQGGSVIGGAAGGNGGEVSDTLAVKPGEQLLVDVGGTPNSLVAFLGLGGWNGGGRGGEPQPSYYGAGGGGASDVRRAPFHLSDRLLVAGGGGGGGGEGNGGAYASRGGSRGGLGGGKSGDASGGVNCDRFDGNGGNGGGATQSAGGTGGECDGGGALGMRGSGGNGGTTNIYTCCGAPAGSPPGIGGGGGGGGGGFYGGGGGGGGADGPGGFITEDTLTSYHEEQVYYGAGGAGGGGGSGLGPHGATFRNGVRRGSGEVTVTYTPNCSSGGPCVHSASAPTAVHAAAGDKEAKVSFAAPAQGSPIESYEVTASPGGAHATGKDGPITVKGLSDGTAYTFTVTATNEIGTGPRSQPSNRVTPAPKPGAPTAVDALAGSHEAIVGFLAPTSRWSPIAYYTVTVSPGGATVRGTGSPITVKGLTNGTTYTFKVTATNGIGTGPASAPSGAVTPVGPPGAPTAAIALAGDDQATVAFNPASPNGSPVQKYTVTASPGGATATGSGSPIVVPGLANGTAYTFTVTASNADGTGPASKASNSVTPAGLPGAPTGVSAVGAAGQAQVSFAAPAANGAAITSYTVTASPGGASATGSASPITVKGLTNGTAYTFTVTATNSVGTGLASAVSAAVTPATVPGAPTGVSVTDTGSARASVTFTAPAATGGAAITKYTVAATSSDGGVSGTASGAGSPIVLTGLTTGKLYTFTVTATNSAGSGPPSTPSAPVTIQ